MGKENRGKDAAVCADELGEDVTSICKVLGVLGGTREGLDGELSVLYPPRDTFALGGASTHENGFCRVYREKGLLLGGRSGKKGVLEMGYDMHCSRFLGRTEGKAWFLQGTPRSSTPVCAFIPSLVVFLRTKSSPSVFWKSIE